MSGYKEVFDKDVSFPVFHLTHKKYRYIYAAIRELAYLPPGKSVLIDLRGMRPSKLQTKCHVFAARFRMKVRTHRTPDGILASRKRGTIQLGHCIVSEEERNPLSRWVIGSTGKGN